MSRPILEHFGPLPLRLPLINFTADQPAACLHEKPRGLWVSARGENDWLEWCRAEEFGVPERFASRTVIHLAPNANILWIGSVAELDAFDAEYGALDPDIEAALALNDYRGATPRDFMRGIDWRKVAARYDGIVIAPYQWGRRLADKCRWYYGWDCASGCIWNPRAIARIEPIAPPVFEPRDEEEAA